MSFVRILIEHADDSVSIMTMRQHNADRAQEAIEKSRWQSRVVRWSFVDDADIPFAEDGVEFDLSFRAAWRWADAKVVIDMPLAREAYRERVRARRAGLFADLTVEQERAGRDAAKLDAIEARRQRLRDAPADPRIEAAQTVEELKALDVLKD